MLVRLIYASRSTVAITETVIDDLLMTSRENNPARGITGVLCLCDDNTFMQVLEGGRDEVNRLYSRVVQDRKSTRLNSSH